MTGAGTGTRNRSRGNRKRSKTGMSGRIMWIMRMAGETVGVGAEEVEGAGA